MREEHPVAAAGIPADAMRVAHPDRISPSTPARLTNGFDGNAAFAVAAVVPGGSILRISPNGIVRSARRYFRSLDRRALADGDVEQLEVGVPGRVRVEVHLLDAVDLSAEAERAAARRVPWNVEAFGSSAVHSVMMPAQRLRLRG